MRIRIRIIRTFSLPFLYVHPRAAPVSLTPRHVCIRNPGGVRFGSAEIYDVIEHCFAPAATHAGHTVVDCLAVGQRIADGDERVILFVKLLEGQVLTGELENRIRTEVRARRSARHVPARVSTVQSYCFPRPCWFSCASLSRSPAGEPRTGRDATTLFAHVGVFWTVTQIIQVDDIPYTVNMKRVEVPVKKVSYGLPFIPPPATPSVPRYCSGLPRLS